MADIEKLLNETISQSEIQEHAEDVAKKLQSDSSFTLLTLIESLGPVLTNQKVDIRKAGLNLISQTILLLPPNHFHSDDVSLLVLFYSDRLKDHHSLLPSCLEGLSGLVQCPELSQASIEKMLDNLFRQVMIQQQVVKDRHTVFSSLDSLLTNRLDVIKSLSTQFTIGFLQAFEGEKDPRNLLMIFDCVARMLDLLDIDHLREDIFESLAVYFPVDFNPPAGTKGNISKNQLILGLRKGLSHPSLSEFTIGLLLEKLDSELESAKIDSLETLSMLSKRSLKDEVNNEQLRELWSKDVDGVWAALKKETMGIRVQISTKVQECALLSITSVSSWLGDETPLVTPSSQLAWDRWLSLVLGDCLVHLKQPTTRLMTSAGKVLASVAASGHRQGRHVLLRAIPLLLQVWKDSSGNEAKEATLAVASEILKAASSSQIGLSDSNEFDELFAIYLSDIRAKKAASITTATDLARCAPILSQSQQEEFLQCLLQGIKEGHQGLGESVAELSKTNHDLVLRKALPFLESLNETAVEAVACLWPAGFFPTTIKSLIDNLVSGRMSLEKQKSLLEKIGEYELRDKDKADLESSHLICKLLEWSNKTESQELRIVLAQLSSLLVPDSHSAVFSLLKGLSLEKEFWVISSILANVSHSVLKESREIVDWVLSQNPNKEENYWKLVSSVVNKLPETCSSLTGTEGVGVAYITVGLARRGDSLSTSWLERLCQQLASPEESLLAVSGFKLLLSPAWWLQPIQGLLFKQRVWAAVSQHLLHQPDSEAHLSALLSLLPHLPPQLLTPALSKLTPLVVKALSGENTALPGINCLLELWKDSSDALVGGYQTELVHHCLRLSSSSAVGVQTRLRSLSLLCLLGGLEGGDMGTTSVQLAPLVTKGLTQAIRDRKRVVRQEAAKARNIWYLVK